MFKIIFSIVLILISVTYNVYSSRYCYNINEKSPFVNHFAMQSAVEIIPKTVHYNISGIL